MAKRLVLILMTALLGLPLWGNAQPSNDDDPPPMMPHRREYIEKRVKTMKMWKLTEELNLSEDQATKFLPLMNEVDRKAADIRHNRQEAMRKLADLAWDEKPDADQINKLIDQLEDLDAQQVALHKQSRKDFASVLKPDQMARLVLFEQRFPEMMRESIREFETLRGPDDRPPMPPPPRRDW